MKNRLFIFGIWLASLACLRAQVSVAVVLDQDQFLPGEALPVAVRTTNLSGQPLHLGDPGWLSFSVESSDNFVVVRTGRVPVTGAFTLPSSDRAIKRVDLAPYFNLTKPGRYYVTATVRIKDWQGREVISQPAGFDIIAGAKIWQQAFGVPPGPGMSNSIPEVRIYALQEANYLRQLKLYFQLTGSSGKIYKVFPIGPMLSFGQPEPQVDRASNLHVLYQDGPHSFNYTVINPDGQIITRQTYAFTTRPRLRADAGGNISVVGGTRLVSPYDIPAPASAQTNVKTTTP